MRGRRRIRRLVCTGLIAGMAACSVPAQTIVLVTPETLTVSAGSPVTFAVEVQGVSNLHLYHVIVHFDNAILRCESVLNGAFLPGTFFFHNPPVLPSDTARYLTVDDALSGLQTRSGSGVFFSVQFTARQPGVSTVTLEEVVLRDGSNQNIGHTNQGGAVTVTGTPVSVAVNVRESWNLVSVPMFAADYRKASLFPTASSAAFRFAGGYVPSDTLQIGSGYWLKFPVDQLVNLSGYALTRDTLDVLAGWNIVGGLSFPVDTSTVIPVPPLNLVSDFYGYARGSGYTPVDTLVPGRGYWLKTDRAGKMVLHAGARSRK
jgi:hypothetical protein